MVIICPVVDSEWEDQEFVNIIKDYSVAESKIQSTQKPIETTYIEREFWERVEKFQLTRVEQDTRIIAKATRNLVWRILSNRDKSAILTLTAKLACYIKIYNSTQINMLEIDSPAQESNLSTERSPSNSETTENTTPRPVDGLVIARSSSSTTITLDDNEWYDDAAITGESYKAKIKSRLIVASDENLCIWGPWFALLLVRLEKRSITK